MCPDDHRINRQENWRFESLGENLHHSGGEMICVTYLKKDILKELMVFGIVKN